MIKIYKKLDRKCTFTSAATWWSSTFESGKWLYVLLSLEWQCYHSYEPNNKGDSYTLIKNNSLATTPFHFIFPFIFTPYILKI